MLRKVRRRAAGDDSGNRLLNEASITRFRLHAPSNECDKNLQIERSRVPPVALDI